MKHQLMFAAFLFFTPTSCLLIQSCGDSCNESMSTSYQMKSASYSIEFLENDTLNTIYSVHYPQVNKTVVYDALSERLVNYLYGYDENIVVLNYAYPNLRPSDTLVVNAKIKGLEEVTCESDYMVNYGKIDVKKHPFTEIITSDNKLAVVRR